MPNMKQTDLPSYSRIYNMATSTPYSVRDILDFMLLSGLKIDDTEKVMDQFFNSGIKNLKDINTLIKLGYFNYR